MGKHRKLGRTCKTFAALGAAAAATTALTIAVVPDSQADEEREALLRLLADNDFRPFGTNPHPNDRPQRTTGQLSRKSIRTPIRGGGWKTCRRWDVGMRESIH